MAGDDYFVNHRNKLRFPWSLYHRPVVDRVAQEIARTAGSQVLNVGSGPFVELSLLPPGRQYTACDIDERAVRAVTELHGTAVPAHLVQPDGELPFGRGEFDVVFACDVIEHVPSPQPWLAELRRVLRPGGRLVVTTPNYGFSTLPLIEYTLLELLARRHGFSRMRLHPTKMNRRQLSTMLRAAGLSDRRVETTSFGWVLFGVGTK